jgi:hypothetical protein
LPIASLAVGYGVKAAEDWRKDRREDRLAQVTREQQLEDERRHRENDFQRETLLELQEALHELIVLANRAASERQADSRERGVEYRQSNSTPETNDAEREHFGRVNLLRARVKDDEARELVKLVVSSVGSIDGVLAQSPQEHRAVLARGSEPFDSFNERVGWLLRERY